MLKKPEQISSSEVHPQNIQIPEKEHAGRISEEQKTKSKPGRSNRRNAKETVLSL